ncbi:hypothetical protein [Cohnella mopanensis]|nr:hypothetical protein [Cohnella mopanensis]
MKVIHKLKPESSDFGIAYCLTALIPCYSSICLGHLLEIPIPTSMNTRR